MLISFIINQELDAGRFNIGGAGQGTFVFSGVNAAGTNVWDENGSFHVAITAVCYCYCYCYQLQLM